MSSDDSYLLQRIAFGLIRHAASVLPPGRDHWAEAMAAELDHIPKRFELPTNYLFYINKYFIYPLHITCTDM
jgi:hypothetical protein